jgi:AcrR family transcriptional regulator
MAANDWLSERRTEVAADRILDAAEELFTRHDPGSVGMNEIAKAAGCSRATLYRYFENREALRTAYVHRETRLCSNLPPLLHHFPPRLCPRSAVNWLSDPT